MKNCLLLLTMAQHTAMVISSGGLLIKINQQSVNHTTSKKELLSLLFNIQIFLSTNQLISFTINNQAAARCVVCRWRLRKKIIFVFFENDSPSKFVIHR